MPETDFLNANFSSTENLSGRLKFMEDGNHHSVATGKDGEWSQRMIQRTKNLSRQMEFYMTESIKYPDGYDFSHFTAVLSFYYIFILGLETYRRILGRVLSKHNSCS